MNKEDKKIENIEKKQNLRELKGVVVSDKMEKTVVVKVSTNKAHKLYKRRYNIDKNYKAHDEKNKYKEGDYVLIKQIRPLSKDKKWVVIKKVK